MGHGESVGDMRGEGWRHVLCFIAFVISWTLCGSSEADLMSSPPPAGLDSVDSERMFPMVWESRTRGHSLRIRGKMFRTELRRNFFTHRVVNVWNSRLQKVVEAKTLCDFKKKLDIALGAKGIKEFEGKVESGL